MISEVIELLQSQKFYGVSKNIEIAKGKNQIVTNFSKSKEKIKRLWLSKKL